MSKRNIFEVCTGSYAGAMAALRGGADRIELCVGLEEGGLTPSDGLIVAVREIEGVKLHVLIRPRGGDFLYTADEKRIILSDIRRAMTLGADGVVIGALNADGTLDKDFIKRCVSEAGAMSVTFHRAFDVCRDPVRALDELIALGCDRVLTSGCAATAIEGIEMLAKLVQRAAGRIKIMPGCGVSPANASEILRLTQATEIHASAREPLLSKMTYRSESVKMGNAERDEYIIKETSESVVRKIREAIDEC